MQSKRDSKNLIWDESISIVEEYNGWKLTIKEVKLVP